MLHNVLLQDEGVDAGEQVVRGSAQPTEEGARLGSLEAVTSRLSHCSLLRTDSVTGRFPKRPSSLEGEIGLQKLGGCTFGHASQICRSLRRMSQFLTSLHRGGAWFLYMRAVARTSPSTTAPPLSDFLLTATPLPHLLVTLHLRCYTRAITSAHSQAQKDLSPSLFVVVVPVCDSSSPSAQPPSPSPSRSLR